MRHRKKYRLNPNVIFREENGRQLVADPVYGRVIRVSPAIRLILDFIVKTKSITEIRGYLQQTHQMELQESELIDVLEKLKDNRIVYDNSMAFHSIALHSRLRLISVKSALLGPQGLAAAGVVLALLNGAGFWFAITRFGEMKTVLADVSGYFSWSGALMGAVCFLFIFPLLHELGHAVVCARWGGKQTEISIMFLFAVIPYYYSSLEIPEQVGKGPRLLIYMAGIMVDVSLLSATVILWELLRNTAPAAVTLLLAISLLNLARDLVITKYADIYKVFSLLKGRTV